MSLNDGKQEKVYHTFLGKKYRLDMIPCGLFIPFSIELSKIRKQALLTVDKIAPNTPSKLLYVKLEEYLDDNPEEAQDQINQMIKAVSVFTEFYSDGEIDEDYIRKNATAEEVTEFIDAVMKIEVSKTVKKLVQRMRK